MGSDFVVENLTKNNKNVIINDDENLNKKNNNFNFFNKVGGFLENCKKSLNKAKFNNVLNVENNKNLGDDKINNSRGNFTNFFKNKQVKVVLIVLFFSVFALIILNSSNGIKTVKTNSDKSLAYMTSLEYCEKLELKLVEVLKNIDGVGNINVMVTVESSPEIKVASNSDEKTNIISNGAGTTTTSTSLQKPIIINSSGNNSAMVLYEITPKVTGVVVVAEGAKDVRVKMDLFNAVQALLGVSNNNIQIYF